MSVELEDITSGYNLSRINSNFQRIEDVLNGAVVWRTGSVAGETLMERDLDMNGNAILNLGVNTNNPDSILTVGEADLRYYNIAGDVLEGTFDAAGFPVTGLRQAVAPSDAVRKQELDSEISSRQSADANIQEQLTGNVPLEASAFSQISWHDQQIPNSVTIPDNKNAWSFGPQMEIEVGQAVTVGEGSAWTIANGRVVEDEDLHNLIADTITTSDSSTTLQVDEIVTESQLGTLLSDVAANTTNVTNLTARMTAEEAKVQPINKGGTNATTAAQALVNLGATGRLLAVRVLTAGVYTPTAGTTSVEVILGGGGAQGGGTAATTAGTSSASGGGGGGGAVVRSRITSGFSGVTVTLGAGGTGAAAGANGNNGAASTFGALLTAAGGTGGQSGAAGTFGISVADNGGVATGGNIFNQNGHPGLPGFLYALGQQYSGRGGHNAIYVAGGGPGRSSAAAGIAATQPGCGGGGSVGTGTSAANAGGAGSAGFCIVYEYA